MVTTTRPLLWVTISGLSILCLYIYFYSNIFYNNRPLLKFRMILLNKTNLFIHQRNEHWHDKIKEKIQARAHFGFIHAFIASISIIVVSELGDKTFFIGAIMAMRHSRLTVYSGAMSALGAMTILSALLGNIVTNFIPRIYTYYLSSLLFAGFGIKMLKDGYAMSSNEGAEEYKEVQEEVEKAESINDLESVNVAETVNKSSKANQQQQQQLVLTKQSITAKITLIIRRYVSVIFIQAFMMTFLAVNIQRINVGCFRINDPLSIFTISCEHFDQSQNSFFKEIHLSILYETGCFLFS